VISRTRRNWTRWGLFAGIVAVLVAGYAAFPVSREAQAAPVGTPTPSTTSPTVNTPFTVTASWDDDSGAGSAILSATELTSGAAGTINTCTLTANSDTQTPGPTIANGTPTDTCTVGPDLDTVVDRTTMSISYTCTAAGQISFSLTEGGTTTAPVIVNCGGSFANTVTVSFSQNPACGPVTATARVLGTSGAAAPDGTLVTFSSNQGFFSPTQASTVNGLASVTFHPSSTFGTFTGATATVTASALGVSGVGTLQLACFGQAPSFFVGDPCCFLPTQVQSVIPQPIIPAPQPVAQPQPQPVAPAPVAPVFAAPPPIVAAGSISPPRTGDAGLLIGQ
jgi:hypothetical protein